MKEKSSRNIRELERDALRGKRNHVAKTLNTTATVVRAPLVQGSRSQYNRMLREWELFTQQYHGEHDPHHIKTAKDFMLFFCDGRLGRNEPGGAITQSYAYTSWKQFMTAWERSHGTPFCRSISATIKNFLYDGDQDNSVQLSVKSRPKRNLTLEDFRICVSQLWQNDWHDYHHERSRIGLHLLLLLHCNTSARRAEFESNLRYEDVAINVVWRNKEDEPQIVIDFIRSNAKGLQNLQAEQPQHMLYELRGLPYYYNAVALFMAAALADGALRGFDTWADICAIKRPGSARHISLEYRENRSGWYVFPATTRDGRLDHLNPSKTLSSTGLVDLGVRAGFQEHITFHAARREALLKIDSYGYSANERMRFAGHIDSNTYRRSYQTPISTVDGQATWFGFEANNSDLHALRRGYTWHRNTSYRPVLAFAERVKLHTGIVEQPATDVSKQSRQRQYDNKRQLSDRLIQKQNAMTSAFEREAFESDFLQARRLMPQRDRLATALFLNGSLRTVQGHELMDDLVHLSKHQNSDTMCWALNRSSSVCEACGKSQPQAQLARHTYGCHKKIHREKQSFADFCFVCHIWIFDIQEWHSHIWRHIRSPQLKCRPATFRYNVLRAGICPACLQESLNGGKLKYEQYLNLASWRQHILEHMPRYTVSCCHPACERATFATAAQLHQHQVDVHELPDELLACRGSSNKPGTLRFVDLTRKIARSRSVSVEDSPLTKDQDVPGPDHSYLSSLSTNHVADGNANSRSARSPTAIELDKVHETEGLAVEPGVMKRKATDEACQEVIVHGLRPKRQREAPIEVTDRDAQAPSQVSAVVEPRRRGRPRGSLNKRTLLRQRHAARCATSHRIISSNPERHHFK